MADLEPRVEKLEAALLGNLDGRRGLEEVTRDQQAALTKQAAELADHAARLTALEEAPAKAAKGAIHTAADKALQIVIYVLSTLLGAGIMAALHWHK